MTTNSGNSDQLQHPGAGLPSLERAVLNAVLKTGSVFLSEKRALQLFLREADELVRIADEDESYDVFQPVLIPRIVGIEDSSRNWSVMMVLEHLCLTNRDMLAAITDLTDGIVPRGEIDIALYKPSPDVGFDVLDRFREITFEYYRAIENLIENHVSLKTDSRYAHPWFGRLNAHQWHYLAGYHQRIHRKQAQKIIAMLGVT